MQITTTHTHIHIHTLAGLLSVMHKCILAKFAVTLISAKAECMQKCCTVATKHVTGHCYRPREVQLNKKRGTKTVKYDSAGK